MNVRISIALISFGLLVGIYIGAKYCPNVFVQEPEKITKEEKRKITRKFDSLGHIASETIIEKILTPLIPKPSYKITLFPIYDFHKSALYWAGLYEKRYDLPFIREVYLGVYVNTRLEAGLSLSKEFF